MLAAKDVPIIPVWQGNMIAAARKNVRGIPSTLDAAFIMRYWKLVEVVLGRAPGRGRPSRASPPGGPAESFV